MAPKPATSEEKAAEEKAVVTHIVAACVRAQVPVCLPMLPGHGRVDVPTVCAGPWGGQLRLGLLCTVNEVRQRQGRKQLGNADSLVKSVLMPLEKVCAPGCVEAFRALAASHGIHVPEIRATRANSSVLSAEPENAPPPQQPPPPPPPPAGSPARTPLSPSKALAAQQQTGPSTAATATPVQTRKAVGRAAGLEASTRAAEAAFVAVTELDEDARRSHARRCVRSRRWPWARRPRWTRREDTVCPSASVGPMSGRVLACLVIACRSHPCTSEIERLRESRGARAVKYILSRSGARANEEATRVSPVDGLPPGFGPGRNRIVKLLMFLSLIIHRSRYCCGMLP